MDSKLVEQLKALFPHGHRKFTELTVSELDLHSRKNKDYAGGGDPLGNFHRVAAILKLYEPLPMSPMLVAIIYAMKQLDQVLWSEHRGLEGEIEDSDARLADIHVYMKLARILKSEQD